MKKLILTSVLSLLAFVGFTSADTVGNFSSNSAICQKSASELFDGYTYFDTLGCDGIDLDSDIYFCISTDNIPYYQNIISSENNINVENYCFSSPMDDWAGNNQAYYGEDTTNIDGYFYFSNSPITIQNTNGGGTNTNNGQLIPGGTSTFTPIITKLGSIAGEFIPYLIYIALGALGVALAFRAVKYIISYLSNKAKGAVKGR